MPHRQAFPSSSAAWQPAYQKCMLKGMYRSLRNGAYYGMNLGSDGLSGFGDVPQPTTDALAASWCSALGLPENYCGVAPGVIDNSGEVHIISDPSGKPCSAGYYASDGSLNPCTWNDYTGISIPPGFLTAHGITKPNGGQYTCDPSVLMTSPVNGEQYAPLSCKGYTLLTQAQTLALIAANGAGSPAPAPLSTQNVYSSAATAQAIASQIVGATVQTTSDGQYAVVAPGYAVATPAVIQTISSNPAPVGSSGSVPGANFYPTPPVYNTSTSPTGTGTQQTQQAQQQQASGSTIPPQGNAQAPPPSDTNFCFPGDTSAPSFIPGMCGNTALGAIGALLLLVMLLKK